MLDTKEMNFVNYILDNVHGFIGLTYMEDKIERLPVFKRLQVYFVRTCNKLPVSAYDILKQCVHEHLYDITDAVHERGLDEVIAFIDNSKADLLKSEQDLDSVERG